MLSFEAHHVLLSSNGRRVLFGAFEQRVAVLELETGVESPSFDTTFDAGGQRLALSDAVNGVLAGAYHNHGLALYDLGTQQEVWRRKDLKRIQQITLSRDGCRAYCGIDGSSLVVVDLASGVTVLKVRGARSLYDSSYDPVSFIDGLRPQVRDDAGARRFAVERTTFAFLDVTFGPGRVCVSEAGGPVRAFELETGKQCWRYSPPVGSHVLRLGYDAAGGEFMAVQWPYKRGGPKALVRIAAAHGTVAETTTLGCPIDCAFAHAGRLLVTTDGDVVDTVTGQPVGPGAHSDGALQGRSGDHDDGV